MECIVFLNPEERHKQNDLLYVVTADANFSLTNFVSS